MICVQVIDSTIVELSFYFVILHNWCSLAFRITFATTHPDELHTTFWCFFKISQNIDCFFQSGNFGASDSAKNGHF